MYYGVYSLMPANSTHSLSRPRRPLANRNTYFNIQQPKTSYTPKAKQALALAASRAAQRIDGKHPHPAHRKRKRVA